eukprot:Seg2192.4 transcript_id=Seg2192.4/GoldUCD/mRNA.D3Y31 product="Tubulin-specific chaperone cofactor E-like protein" protein_id=Seg2192.4/GoldUCD/D3Y31
MVEEAEEPCTFAEALNNKYMDYEPKLFDNIQLSPKRRAALLNKQSHQQRQILALDGCNVGSAGEDGEIAGLCPNLTELDLTKNYLQSWEQIFLIIAQLPRLTFLNLTSNPLDFNFEEERIEEIIQNNTLPKLERLVLNNTKLPLELVFKLLCIFPGVEELHLSLNAYGHVIEWHETFPNIQKLHFNSNDIEDWDDIINVGKVFPNLRRLILCGNAITEVKASGEEFLELQTLSLSQTSICEWNSLDELCKLAALEDLRVVGVPLGQREGANRRRQLFIARLPTVKKLNGSVINETEREDAERMFIRHHMDDEEPPERYHKLVEVHGKLERLAEVDLGRREYARLVVCLDGKEVSKIIVDLSIYSKTLKQNVGKKVGLAPKDFHMYFRDNSFKNEVRDPYKYLFWYKLVDGDKIIVVQKKQINY